MLEIVNTAAEAYRGVIPADRWREPYMPEHQLEREIAEPRRTDVPNFERLVRVAGASHWVQHDEPERVSEVLIGFFAG